MASAYRTKAKDVVGLQSAGIRHLWPGFRNCSWVYFKRTTTYDAALASPRFRTKADASVANKFEVSVVSTSCSGKNGACVYNQACVIEH